jgi:hypothetical protein
VSNTITCSHVKMQMALIARCDTVLSGYTDRVTASFYIRLQCESRVGRKVLWQPFAVSNDDQWVQAPVAPSCRRITGQALALPLRANSTNTIAAFRECQMERPPCRDLTVFSVRLTHSGFGPSQICTPCSRRTLCTET